MAIALIGLVLIIIGWAIQAYYVYNGKKEVHQLFIAAYMIGVLLLVIDGFMNNLTSLAILNLISLVVSGLVLVMLFSKPKAKKKK
jgi:CDP-diglyceride synthetase